ncbi:hypothetical protein [Niallia endozanthoxylica]|uniref:Uncharacterized protein n=1 Tax=Niallia endozanthoxylica TaxID=2036016 RepID=A0A5J5HPH8_9BACI|nr:hypothetical protein [Niallia endozanthoxylica]KAA9023644.1 hypothetical protein F4V44_13385 [Niallia endozanthoxylica]
MDISNLLGEKYFSLDAAQVDKSPEELVVTDNDETYYIVSSEAYEQTLKALQYKIVVDLGE